jgi:hypothetical protein
MSSVLREHDELQASPPTPIRESRTEHTRHNPPGDCQTAPQCGRDAVLRNYVQIAEPTGKGSFVSSVYGHLVITLEARDARAFLDLALDQMMAKAVALGPRVSDRPQIEGANSAFSLVVHCLGVAEWWLDHAVLGHPSSRERDAEFGASGTIAELESLVEAFRELLPALMDEVAEAPEPRSSYLEAATASFRSWPWTTGSIVVHVIEELFQHAGHVDLTADLLAAEEHTDAKHPLDNEAT